LKAHVADNAVVHGHGYGKMIAAQGIEALCMMRTRLHHSEVSGVFVVVENYFLIQLAQLI
jgi:hypothetical protein